MRRGPRILMQNIRQHKSSNNSDVVWSNHFVRIYGLLALHANFSGFPSNTLAVSKQMHDTYFVRQHLALLSYDPLRPDAASLRESIFAS